jgi:DNA-directed RNA polymerase specialized sigma24 family protein
MSSEGSVTHWLTQLQAGDAAAVQPLWERYFSRLVGLARQKLQGRPRGAADEEDVALSAFDSFCRAAERGCFPQLGDRDSLWRLLVVITARKAAHLARDEGRHKRGGGAVVDATEAARLDEVLGPEPTPAFAAQAAEEYRRLLALLGDADLQRAAVLKMEGYTVEEIATQLGRESRTVKRWLQLIRQIWEKELQA